MEDPLDRFQEAYRRAAETEPFDVARCALATASAEGRPSVRFVLVKDFDRSGFAVYTNYGSQKARELDENPWGALVFHWHSTGEQVRVSGPVSRAPNTRSDQYFHARPRGSRVGAWASEQSRPIESRAALIAQVNAAEQRFEGSEVPRPAHWGGFVLRPDIYEFWSDGEHRLHDRERYELSPDGAWSKTRLQP